jgi:hypothetical protein
MVRSAGSCGAVLWAAALGAVVTVPSQAGATGREAGPAIVAPSESMPAIKRALALLPRKPGKVAVVDAEGAGPEIRERLDGLDAFVTKGGRTVYLMHDSEVLKRAQTGSPLFVCMLAAIIWHELAHIDGADEKQAQRQEESLWKRFLLDERVDRVTALRYLAAMNDRRH